MIKEKIELQNLSFTPDQKLKSPRFLFKQRQLVRFHINARDTDCIYIGAISFYSVHFAGFLQLSFYAEDP